MFKWIRKTQVKNKYYIGLMSGSSLDGVDAVLVDFNHHETRLLATHQHPIPQKLRALTLDLCNSRQETLQLLGEADAQWGDLLADTVLSLLKKNDCSKNKILAIGSHGQTVRHNPNGRFPFTLQIGDPNRLVIRTGITTVADFRRRDLALGGQGAPLVPAFHDYLFRSHSKPVVILNIGGIANITILSSGTSSIVGFDTGPGNILMDAWCYQHKHQLYDTDGQWAKQGQCHAVLLSRLLSDPYFQQRPPKSTGREYFQLKWLEKYLAHETISPDDIQATLLELTVQSIAQSLLFCLSNKQKPKSSAPIPLYVCGGGAHNTALINRLHECIQCSVFKTDLIGLPVDWVEACAFAWLAQQTLLGKASNVSSVTGAQATSILGGIYR